MLLKCRFNNLPPSNTLETGVSSSNLGYWLEGGDEGNGFVKFCYAYDFLILQPEGGDNSIYVPSVDFRSDKTMCNLKKEKFKHTWSCSFKR